MPLGSAEVYFEGALYLPAEPDSRQLTATNFFLLCHTPTLPLQCANPPAEAFRQFVYTNYRPNMESGIRPPVESSVCRFDAAAITWSAGRFAMRSRESAMRDNS